jgi:hypothetical protein
MLETVKNAATVVALIGGLVSIVVAMLGVYRQWAWSKRERAEAFLTSLVNDFGAQINAIEDTYNWNIINDRRDYDAALKAQSAAKRKGLERDTRKLLRGLEAMAIRIKHGLLDDRMCKDYLRSIARQVLEKTGPFIDRERTNRDEPAIFEEFEKAAIRWQRR